MKQNINQKNNRATLPQMHPTQYFTYPVLSIVIPAFVALITTLLVIRFGPNRREVSKLAKLVQGIADEQNKEKLLSHFHPDITLENLVDEGSRVTLKSTTPFRLLQVKVANANHAPFSTINVGSGVGLMQSCQIPYEAINTVYWSTSGTTTKDGILLFLLEVEGVTLHRERGVSLLQLPFQKSGDPTFRQFIKMS